MLSSLFKSIFNPREPNQPEPYRFKCRRSTLDISLNTVIQQQGSSMLLRCDYGTILITDLIVQCQSNNTFQIFAGAISISPVLTFTPNQPATFSGIVLPWPEALTINCGNNSPIAVNVRYKIYR